MKRFYIRWEERNKQERLELLRKFIKPLYENKELNLFLANAMELVKSIDEKIYYLQYCRKLIAQTVRKPDEAHFRAFRDEYELYFLEIEQEQEVHNSLKWVDAELQYLQFLKSENQGKVDEQHRQISTAEKDWLTTPELLVWLGISKATLHRKMAQGLPKTKIGRGVRFVPEEVKAWIASQNN
ncbi:helix-turn-helix transcriptional regulator [Pedobacter helvus]|uniref:Helix-turn-helix transcriptional regulator n=1 Tax=Pedobacter helvus TaxID=2563444 RepID=A0ABW9JK96_9SPHI|nr:helix-turn-helix domain-containing protein [Pedobacter ureilyticus]